MKIIKTISILALVALVGACGDMESASFDSPASANGGVGQTGSLARFAITNDRLFMADETRLLTYDIDQLDAPQYISSQAQSFVIQTLFARDNNTLFAGGDRGMAIFDVSDGNPSLLDMYTHIQSCDPVVADSTHAYVTLNSNNGCNGVSQLDVLNVSDLSNIQLITTLPLANPKGLCIKGDRLYVCNDGVMVFDITDRDNPNHLRTVPVENAVDIVAYNGSFFITTLSGVKIVDIDETGAVTERSSLW